MSLPVICLYWNTPWQLRILTCEHSRNVFFDFTISFFRVRKYAFSKDTKLETRGLGQFIAAHTEAERKPPGVGLASFRLCPRSLERWVLPVRELACHLFYSQRKNWAWNAVENIWNLTIFTHALRTCFKCTHITVRPCFRIHLKIFKSLVSFCLAISSVFSVQTDTALSSALCPATQGISRALLGSEASISVK